MKRYGYLFERICSLDNLRAAAYNAAQGKRRRDEVQKFFAELESNLQEIRTELLGQTYRTSPYEVFIKYEPKRREIYKLPFKDRVVQWAICWCWNRYGHCSSRPTPTPA